MHALHAVALPATSWYVEAGHALHTTVDETPPHVLAMYMPTLHDVMHCLQAVWPPEVSWYVLAGHE